MRRLGAGLLRADLRYREHLNQPPSSKEPNAAAVGRGYGSMGLVFNSFEAKDALPDLPENTWDGPAVIRGLREAFQAGGSKWP